MKKDPWWYDLHWQVIMLVGGVCSLYILLVVLNHCFGPAGS